MPPISYRKRNIRSYEPPRSRSPEPPPPVQRVIEHPQSRSPEPPRSRSAEPPPPVQRVLVHPQSRSPEPPPPVQRVIEHPQSRSPEPPPPRLLNFGMILPDYESNVESAVQTFWNRSGLSEKHYLTPASAAAYVDEFITSQLPNTTACGKLDFGVDCKMVDVTSGRLHKNRRRNVKKENKIQGELLSDHLFFLSFF